MNSRHLPVSALLLLLAATGSAAAQDTAAPFAPIVQQERAVLDALVKPDTAAFNRALGSDFVYVDVRGATRWELAKTTAMLMDCKTSSTLDGQSGDDPRRHRSRGAHLRFGRRSDVRRPEGAVAQCTR